MTKPEKIILIQNTEYHFETILSVYKSLEDIGVETYLHRCCGDDKMGQLDFIKFLGIRLASEQDLDNARCAFIVSAYPSPFSRREEWIPNGNDPSIKRFGNRIVYISHRFSSREDYESNPGPVRFRNALCLSPLSSRIGVDYLWLIDMPIKPEKNPLARPVQLTVQGHFELKNRLFPDWVFAIEDGPKRAHINFIGSSCRSHLNRKTMTKNFTFMSNQKEASFYEVLNKKTHFLMPMIDGKIKKGTYLKERFSSNFNQAFAMEKPVFCHMDFKEIYGVPGVYYDDDNALNMVEKVLQMTEEEYDSMVFDFSKVKAPLREHNRLILRSKIEAVCG